jgi:N-acetylglucosaminyl-diphospho-decaprenol L-rhamnosyltransferase
VTSTTVIVATCDGHDRVASLLSSLEDQTVEHEVLLVDNGSRDPRVARLGERFDGVQVIRFEQNEGFSRAVNVAADRADGDSLVLVNDDCTCDSPFVEELTAALDPAGGTVMAAGVLRDQGDPGLIDTAGMELDSTLLVFDYLNGESVDILGRDVPDPVGPCGAAAAFDRNTFLAAGGFDERLFAYWEDVDLVLRLRREGASCALARRALGTHAHSATLGPGSARKDYLTGFGRGYVLRKWRVLNARRLVPVIARDAVVCVGQAVFDRNLAGVRGRVRGFLAAKPLAAFPPDVVAPGAPSAAATLRRRARRRARIRRRGDVPKESTGSPRLLAIFHSAELGGPARSLEGRLGWVARNGSLEVIVPGEGRVGELYSALGRVTECDYDALVLPSGVSGPWHVLRRLKRDVRTLRGAIRQSRPDVVLVVTTFIPAALIAARLERVPAIVHAAELYEGEGRSRRRALAARLVTRLVGRVADTVVACSQAVARQFDGVRGARVTVVYPPIDANREAADRERARSRYGVAPGAPCLVSVGNINEGKGQHLLIQALAEVRRSYPDAMCVIAGEPFPRAVDRAYWERLDALVASLALEDAVVLPGFVEDVAELYAAADVVVNPARWNESFGRVAFEAAIADRPTVTSATGAVGELLRDGESALMVRPGDHEVLASAICRLIDDPGLGERLAAEARRIALERLGAERAVSAFAELVPEVLARR